MTNKLYGLEMIDYTGKKEGNFIVGIQNGQCQRCLSKKIYRAYCFQCKKECAYCTDCIQLGKVTACCRLVYFPDLPSKERMVSFHFQNALSKEQKRASDKIVQSIRNYQDLLLIAVTGAGKTEMLFHGIYEALTKGYRVCIASPRIDVCLELAPRIQHVFPTEDILVLHGRQKEPYRYTKLVIATTHQLLRFKEAFDVVIIDECDAYPYVNNPVLVKRIPKVVKAKHSIVYMTATPTKEQEKSIQNQTIQSIQLPARYHQYALPVPVCYFVGNWQKNNQKCKKKDKVIQLLTNYVNKGEPFLVFLPNIQSMLQLEKKLKRYFDDTVRFTSVYAQDNKRLEKVQAMRDKQYHFLLTTTILERGVTFSGIHVLIIGAENHQFKVATLIQIAGRVGRKEECPTGDVIFAHNGKTKAMKQAIQRIEQMNRLAREKGLIK